MAKRFENFQEWMENEAKLSYAADMARYVTTPITPTAVIAETHYESVEDDGSVVELGVKSIADAQREADDNAGGLLAIMFNRKY